MKTKPMKWNEFPAYLKRDVRWNELGAGTDIILYPSGSLIYVSKDAYGYKGRLAGNVLHRDLYFRLEASDFLIAIGGDYGS